VPLLKSGTYTVTGTGGTTSAQAGSNQIVVFNLAGTVATTVQLLSNVGASITVNDTLSVVDPLILLTTGGNITLGTLGNSVGPLSVTINGGSFNVGGTDLPLLNGGTITYGASGGTTVLGDAGSFQNLSFAETFARFVNSTDIIDDQALSFSGFQSYSISGTGAGLQTVTVTDTAGNFSFTTNAANLTNGTYTSLSGGGLSLSSDGTTGTNITAAPCFSAGTMILTPDGEVPVEHLCVGDLVCTLSDDAKALTGVGIDHAVAAGSARAVKWIGRRRVSLTRHAEPELVRPIRIKANAIAEATPSRDLLVSPDHALFIDGKLIPARLLRNGATIHEDHAQRSVTYFHVELETHDVLLADGMPAESYLDTGNRATFDNAGLPVVLHPDFGALTDQARREAGSCVPLVSDPASVEPVWRAIAQRAAILGFDLPSVATTADPDLCILADGKRITPVSRENGTYTFILPKRDGEARLVSRSAKPSALQPWIEDRRNFGVMVRQIVVRNDDSHTVIAADDPRLSDGWWASERDAASIWRWTDGNAILPIDHGPAIVELLIGDTQAYPLSGHDEAATPVRGLVANAA